MDVGVASVIVATIAAAASIGTVVIQGRQGRRLNEVHDQVKNTHTTNLREDLDQLHVEVSGLREDLRLEREERLQLAHILIGGTQDGMAERQVA